MRSHVTVGVACVVVVVVLAATAQAQHVLQGASGGDLQGFDRGNDKTARHSSNDWGSNELQQRRRAAADDDDWDDVEKCERSYVVTQTDPCAYVQNNCTVESNLNFIEWHYCTMFHIEWLSYIVQSVLVVCIFVWLSTNAEEFFVPQMEAIVQTLQLSQNVAGVTFLALANSAPDLVGSVISINQGNANLALSQLVGAGTFVTTVVVGIISLIGPFKLTRRPFLRDILLYLSMAVFMLLTVVNGVVTLTESIILMCMYVVYVIIVVVGRMIHQRWKKMHEAIDDRLFSSSVNAIDDAKTIADNEQQALLKPYTREEWEPELSQPFETAEQPKRLVELLFPIVFEWEDASWASRVYKVIAAPVRLVLTISVPVVDVHRDDLRWNKWLFMIQLFILPMWVVTATGFVQAPVGNDDFQAWALALILGGGMALLALMFAPTRQTPRFFRYVFFLGFVSAALWLYTICGELIGLLQSLGRLMNLSDTILGLTVLAWGNSIGDLVSNPSLARKGYPGIGVSASFGGPLLNLVMGLGLGFTLALLQNGGEGYPVQISPALWTAFAGLLASLTISLIFITVNGFRGSRIHGIILIIFYILFLSANITVEFLA